MTKKTTSKPKTPAKAKSPKAVAATSKPNIDVTGTSAGLVKQAEKVNTVAMGCVSPCDSKTYVQVKLEIPDNSGHRIYRCLKCGRTKSLNVGGPVNI